MNKYIEELVNGWGLGTDTHVITAIIVLMSVITMCAVFWLIFHLVSPKSSHFREMCFKVIICTTAALLVITTFVSIGGNVVIREELVTKENNANIRASSIEPLQLYDYSNPSVNQIVTLLLGAFAYNEEDVDVYANIYQPEEALNVMDIFLDPLFIKKPDNERIYAPYIIKVDMENPTLSLYGIQGYTDPLNTQAGNVMGGKALIISEDVYELVVVPKGYIPYECKQYNGQPVIIEVNPQMPYDPDYD